MENFEIKLEKYADLAVKAGVNIQRGQTLVISSPITCADFVRKVAKKAYDAGAKNVHVEWSDEELTLIKFLNAPDEAFKEFPLWKAKGYEEMAKEGAAFLTISASNPELLKNVNPQRIADANRAGAQAMQEYRKYTQTGKVSWAVVSVPTQGWAAKVFPEFSEDKRIEELWDKIFKVTRVNEEDPVAAWQSHVNYLKEKLNLLNSKKFSKLHIRARGTDLTLELPSQHLWVGGGLTNETGTYFIPNMPTEEIFTLPSKEGVNGTVSSTKPLNYGGNLINNFTLTFEKGKIVDFTAETGYETMKKLIETDEGSHYLGEVALVPHHSPVSDCNIVFYNTLFDENASCHLALGAAYPLCLEGGSSMTKDDLLKAGANVSLTHVDFMIGNQEMSIDGYTMDGEIVPLFRNGNWA